MVADSVRPVNDITFVGKNARYDQNSQAYNPLRKKRSWRKFQPFIKYFQSTNFFFKDKIRQLFSSHCRPVT